MIHKPKKTTIMKNQINYIALLAMVCMATLVSCKKDEPVVSTALSQEALVGTWQITISQGTEWEKGKGIITPKANEPSLLNATLKFIGSEVTVTSATGTVFVTTGFTIDAAKSTATITGVGLFNIKNYVGGKSMDWEQREPLDTDYEAKSTSGGTRFLYFQKFWTMQKK
jgi:hypothetical protein